MKTLLTRTCSFILGTMIYANSSEALTIYYDDTRSGETSMARGIAASYHGKTGKEAELITFTEETEARKLSERLKGEKDTLLLVGHGTFPVISEYASQLRRSGWILGHVSHQLFDEHSQAVALLDVVFLPEYLRGTSVQAKMLPDASNVSWTNGVAYHLSEGDIKTSFLKKESELPQAQSIVTLYLGGDAEDLDGAIKLYGSQEAEALAEYVHEKESDSHVVVINGPRTGKHNSDSSEIAGVHRGEAPTDHVTAATTSIFEKAGHPHTVYDFRFGEPSMYQPVLGMLLEKGGKLYVPAESNSVIADIVAMGLQDKAVAFSHKAMNELHHANLEYAYKNQGVSYIGWNDGDESYHLHKASAAGHDQPNPNEQIIGSLLKLM